MTSKRLPASSSVIDRISRIVAFGGERMVWLIVLLGLAHRTILFARLRNALTHLVGEDPNFHVVQLFPREIYDQKFLMAMWLLQQTPPIPHVIFKLATAITAGPAGTAQLLCALQGGLSILTAALLCAFLRDLTGSRILSGLAALWFLFSTDLVVAENAFFGQMFYETLTMLIVLSFTMQACAVSKLASATTRMRVVVLGLSVAAAALTRSSMSYMPAVVGLAGMISWPRRTTVVYVLTVVALCGAWSVKNLVSLGAFRVETTSWSGMNLAKNVYWAKQGFQLQHDIAGSAEGDYPDWFKDVGSHEMFPFDVSKTEVLPPELRSEDDSMTRRLGGLRAEWNLPSVAAESDAWRKAVFRFSINHPDLLVKRTIAGYAFVWQRVADYAYMFPWCLVSVEPRMRSFPGLVSRGFGEKLTLTTRVSGAQRASGLPITLFTVSLAPLDALAIVMMHAVLPFLLLLDVWRRYGRGRRPPYLAAATFFPIVVVFFGLTVFSVGEGGENMRFRLSIEPVIIVITVCCLSALAKAAQDGWRVVRHVRQRC